MNESNSCPECGAVIPDGLPKALCPQCALKTVLDLSATPADPGPNLGSQFPSNGRGAAGEFTAFGEYELLEEIARGGMGVVYKARQKSLDRLVAVKMLLFGSHAGAELVRRFKVEAIAAGSLHHPNIVAIHEVGFHDGQNFIVMDYVDGPNLATLVRDQPLPAQRAAGYVRTITMAIHYAHERGILHRDLKPSNVLIDSNGQPRVTDFGLAKRFAAPASGGPAEGAPADVGTAHESLLTLTGQVLGSPNYMPPEQAAPKRGQVSRRSDVYGLGAILYHLLTGRPPFQSDTVTGVLHEVLNSEPVSPRLLNAAVPRDLETICLKCLAKEQERRYPTALRLAEDLDRFLNHQTILARPAGGTERAWRWCRRKPAVAALSAAVVLLMIAVTFGSLVASFRLEQEARQTREAEKKATEKLWDSYLSQARANRWSGRTGRRFESLAALSNAAAFRVSSELRDEAIACLTLIDVQQRKEWRQAVKFVDYRKFDRELRRHAHGDQRGQVRILAVEDDRELIALPSAGAAVQWIPGFSPNDQLLAVCYRNGRARIWDLGRREPVLETPSRAGAEALDFSPDNREVAVVAPSGALSVFDLATKSSHPVLPANGASAVRFNPTGRRLAAVRGSTVLILDARSGSELARLIHPAKPIFSMAWHPDGQHLATACSDHNVYVWDVEDRSLFRLLTGHQLEPQSVAFTHSGDVLASSSWDGRTRFWDFRAGKTILTLAEAGTQVAFSQDDTRFGLGAWDGHELALYDFDPARESRVWRHGRSTEANPIRESGVAFNPTGTLLAYSDHEQVRLLQMPGGRELASLPMGGSIVNAFAADGDSFYTGGVGGLARWPIRRHPDGQQLAMGPAMEFKDAKGAKMYTAHFSLSDDGRFLAAVHQNRAHVFEAATGRRLDDSAIQQRMHFVDIHPSARWMATGNWNAKGLKIWDLLTGELKRKLPSLDITRPVFSPDGQLLVVHDTASLTALDTRSWTNRFRIPCSQDLPEFAFSEDGRLLAVRVHQTAVQLFDARTGVSLAKLEAATEGHVTSLAFNSNATLLAVCHGTPELRVWDLRRVRAKLASLRLDWELPPYEPAAKEPPSIQAITVESVSASPLVSEFPARQAACPEYLINLSPHYNVRLDQNWHAPQSAANKGNNLSRLPQGIQTLDGVAFDVRGIVQLSSLTMKKVDPRYPKEVPGIRVGLRARRLHFLQAVGYQGKDGMEVGAYVIRYADGQTHTIPIQYGEDVRDWWLGDKPSVPLGRGSLAWMGKNDRNEVVRLFRTQWENPRPDEEISTLDYISRMTDAAPFLIAITAESLDARERNRQVNGVAQQAEADHDSKETDRPGGRRIPDPD